MQLARKFSSSLTLFSAGFNAAHGNFSLVAMEIRGDGLIAIIACGQRCFRLHWVLFRIAGRPLQI